MIELGLYTGGSANAPRAIMEDRGLHVGVAANATLQNNYLQGELAWKSNNETEEMQMPYYQVSNDSMLSFQCSISP